MKDTFISKRVVLDTSTNWIYIGVLEGEDSHYYYLSEADAFDVSEVNMTKHEYLVRIKKDGLVVNRKKTIVAKEKVIAITLLEDIIEK
ncbi:MAG TPA: hypothetical protein PK303_03750 [bacterium]|nr:hypothetical protein [bacterium]HOL34901.1 hypothetical protein [bacterium]HPP08220.1 hypothetical protein [bacterium]